MAGAWVSVHLRVGLCALPAPRLWELAGLSASASIGIHRPWEEIAIDCFSFPHVDPKVSTVSQSFLESNGCWDHFLWLSKGFP